MIQNIYLKNFRSIESANVDLSNELKVLIGENGTGKTNILLALKFISSCVSESPLRAIQNAGGLDQVFRIKERRASKCTFGVVVKMPNRNESHRVGRFLSQGEKGEYDTKDYYIKYEFSLKYVSNEQQLYVSNEILSYWIKQDEESIIFDREKEELGREKFQIREDEFSEYDVDALFIHKVALGHLNHKKYSGLGNNIQFEIDLTKHFLFEISNIVGFNFSPHVLRKTSDTLDSSHLGYNGQNFPTILNSIAGDSQTRNNFWRKYRGRYSILPKNRKKIVNDIQDSYIEILPFLKSVDVAEGLESTELTIKFKEQHLKNRYYNVRHLSDGTLKFIALSTVISMSNYSFLFLEEIENYLNPKAILYLLDLMRNYAKELNVQFLITTHSETVLNLSTPNEVLISKRNEAGGTIYINPKNIDTLEKELENGGFGLGTYWGNGGIEID